MSDIPPDKNSRDIIQNATDINIIVDAGAGSGKTSSLVGRMLGLILTEKYKVNEIAAITFTRKAASELKKRFQIELEKKTGVKSLNPANEALKNLEHCYIGTIHSFCAQMLRERPVEAGIDPYFKETDEAQDLIIQEKAWHAYLLDKSSEINELTDLGIIAKDLEWTYKCLNNYSDVQNIYSKVKKPDLKDACERVLSLCDDAYPYIPDIGPEKEYDDLQKAIIRAYNHRRYFDLQKDASIINLLLIFDKNNRVTQKRWTDKKQAKNFGEAFKGLRRDIIQPVLDRWREFCHSIVMDFIGPAVEYYNRYKDEHSILSFQDLLTKTALMLKEHKEVREYFSRKYKCLLVDEFQDTDPVQAEILLYLTGKNTLEKKWTKLVPRPGSLFVVGDPKQSIYRFRRADIDIYNLIKRIIIDNGGKLIQLISNFRSLNDLGEWYNRVFSSNFPPKDNKYQPAYDKQHAIRKNIPGCESGVKILRNTGSGNQDNKVMEDAVNISKYIRWAVDTPILLCREDNTSSPAEYKDFLIILHFKKHMDIYLSTLEEFGIPVDISGKSSLSDSEELNELILLLKFLQDTSNPVALISVLKGFFFGISDNELYRYKKASGKYNIYASIPDNFSLKEKFSSVFSKLKEYNTWKYKYSPSVCIEKIIRDTGLLAHSLGFPDRKSRSGHILEMIELIKEFELKGTDLFSEAVDLIEGILKKGTERELNILYDEYNVVRLMNLHKAKGLEAPVVFLANPAQSSGSNVDCHIKRTGDIAEGYFTVKRQAKFNSITMAQPVSWSKYQKEEEEYTNAEKLRLLYVAATRAKNLLIISSHEKNNRNPWNMLLEHIPSDNTANKDDIKKPNPFSISFPISSPDYIETWMDEQSLPSYRVTLPAELKKSNLPLSKADTQAKGREWGTAVHKAIEILLKTGKDNIDKIIRFVIKGQNLDKSLSKDLKDTIEKFLSSSLYNNIEKADKVLSEVPFYIKTGKEIPQNIDEYISGTIDLILKDKDGYTIIDFKTTLIEDPRELKKLAEAYSPQIKTYCRVFEEITGKKAKKGEIWFIGKGNFSAENYYTGYHPEPLE